MRIEGRNPVLEALRAGVPLQRILIAEGVDERAGTVASILSLAGEQKVAVERIDRRVMDEEAASFAHQGVVAEAGEFRFRPWQEGVAEARQRGEVPFLLALDGITDPQNAGSLIRSAHVFGAHVVLLPGRRAAPVTPAMIKASAGAIWHICVDQVTNLERTLADCKRDGIWILGLDASADTEVSNCPLLSEPLALTVGSEGKGLSRLLRERADMLVGIAQVARFDSLGAAAAGAVALYAVARGRSSGGSGSQLSGS